VTYHDNGKGRSGHHAGNKARDTLARDSHLLQEEKKWEKKKILGRAPRSVDSMAATGKRQKPWSGWLHRLASGGGDDSDAHKVRERIDRAMGDGNGTKRKNEQEEAQSAVLLSTG
jgi:hypothetical protein